jgi:HK97 family phage portal protein
MPDSIYNLSLVPGDMVLKGRNSSSFEASSYVLPASAGDGWTDMFHKDRAPTPRELVHQLVGTAYACATLNSDLVASATLRLYVATRPGEPLPPGHLHARPVSRKTLSQLEKSPAVANILPGAAQIHEITRHPLLDLLKSPQSDPDNPGLSGYDLRWTTQLYLESVGRAYWLIERDSLGIPGRIWLLRSHLVREIADTTGKRLISHYEYGPALGRSYQPNEIIRFHFPNPENPYFNGYSPMRAAIEKIRIARKEEAHLNAMLENMGRPDAVFCPKGDSEGGGIGVAEAQRLRSAFRQAFAMAGRGGLLISEVPGTLQPLQWSPQDIVEIQRAKALKTDICNVFGVPDAKLERNAANLAGAKTADYAHKLDAGLPRIRRIEETLNARLVPMFDNSGRMFVAYDSPLPEDEIFALEQVRTASMSGAITRNEIRSSVGLGPTAWGEQPLVPNNMVEVDPQTGKPEHIDANTVRSLVEGQTKLASAVEQIAQHVKGLAQPSALPPEDSCPTHANKPLLTRPASGSG